MTILVTGGLGFIGSKVVLQLLKRNIDVIAADLDIKKNKNKLKENINKFFLDDKLIKYEKLDITNSQQIENIFKNNKI